MRLQVRAVRVVGNTPSGPMTGDLFRLPFNDAAASLLDKTAQ